MLASARTRLRDDRSQRLAVIATAATCGVLLIWAAVATLSAYQSSRELAQAKARVEHPTPEPSDSHPGVLPTRDPPKLFGE